MPEYRTEIVVSPSFDPWTNLALEEHLLGRIREESMTLYLWRNEHTVVIGRNQNAWRECRTELLEREGGRLARRLSGGGAVYHDLGNCNFTFLASPRSYDFDRQIRVIAEALRDLGISASFGGRNDLFVEGRKISGNAFYRGRSGRYHHGTILMDVDMDRLTRYLQPSKAKLDAKGVTSVRSRVANLREFVPSLSMDDVQRALRTAFHKEFGDGPESDAATFLADPSMRRLRDMYASREWIYGRTPVFDAEIGHRFDWGELQIGMTVERGVITECRVFSDAMDADYIAHLADLFPGAAPDGASLAACVRDSRSAMAASETGDILSWLESAGSGLI